MTWAKRAVVLGLLRACEVVDTFARRLPFVAEHYGCHLALLSLRLDDRWRVGVWSESC